jgi:hypothetical protein
LFSFTSIRVKLKINQFATVANPFIYDFRGTDFTGIGYAAIDDSLMKKVFTSTIESLYINGVAQNIALSEGVDYEIIISGGSISSVSSSSTSSKLEPACRTTPPVASVVTPS